LSDPLDRDVPVTKAEGAACALVLMEIHAIVLGQQLWEYMRRTGRYKWRK
jgi:hypothetical protein